MKAEILLNLVWAVWAWTAAATGCVLLMRRAPAVLRRQICRLGLIGVPITMLGVGLWHSNRPGAGLWVRHVQTASVRAAPEPAPELPAVEIASLPPAAEDLPDPSGAAAPPLPVEPEAPAPAHVALAESPRPRPRPAAAAPRAPAAAQPGEPWRWLLYPAGGVSLLMLLTLAARQLRLALWRRTWRPATPAWQSLTARLARRVGLRGPVRTFMAERLSQPAAAGIIRPAVVLPAHHGQPLGPALRGVLAHEVAHLRGRDPLWNLISGAVLACAWCCPLTWWLHRRMRIESELTADDHALAAGAAPMSLAQTLARLAEGSRPRTAVVMSQMACHLKRRIKMMLNERIPHSPRSPLRWRLGLTAIMCLVCAALICTPLVGVVRADEPKPAAVATAPDAPGISDPRSVGRGSASEAAVVTTRPRRTATGHEVVSLRISVKGGRVVIETADGQQIVAKEIVAVSTSDAGKTAFRVERRGDRVYIVSLSPGIGKTVKYLPTGSRTRLVTPRRTTTRLAGQVRAVRIYALKHTKAAEIAPIVTKAWEMWPDVKITCDPRTNSLIVLGTRAETEAIAALIKSLDGPGAVSTRPAAPPREVNVYPLKHADAGAVVNVLVQMLEGNSVTAMTLAGSNSVVVRGTKADMAIVEQLLKEMDVAPTGAGPGKKVAPKKAPERPAALRDAQLCVLLREAERRVIDFETKLKLAELNAVRVVRAHQSKAATAEEVEMAKIQFLAAKKKLDSAANELEELRRLATKPARPPK